MIGKLTGKAEVYNLDSVIMDVNKVGYIVYCTQKTIHSLLNQNNEAEISIFIEMQIRQDDIIMFGFETNLEKQCFKILNSVQGIGGKVAIAIMNHLSTSEIVNAIKNNNTSRFSGVSGIGPKLAKRIITELQNNKNLILLEGHQEIKNQNTEYKLNEMLEIAFENAISGLINLGFNKIKVKDLAEKLMQKIHKKEVSFEYQNKEDATEYLIKILLNEINKS